MSHIIEVTINKFLKDIQAKPYSIPKELLDKFGAETKEALVKQFERIPREFTLRMSNVGKSLCQLQMEQQYGSRGNNLVKFLYGDLVEDVILFLLHASGLKVVAELEPVSLKLAGTTIKGTLDVVIEINGIKYVFDIKSASDFSFKSKQDNSFRHFVEQDAFGYLSQLFMYAEARGYKPGGFIFGNKVDGDIFVLAIPEEHAEYKKLALDKARNNIKAIKNSTPFKRSFEDKPELFYNKETGNRQLGFTCSYCDYKNECWTNLKILPQISSKGKNPKLVYYTHIKDDTLYTNYKEISDEIKNMGD